MIALSNKIAALRLRMNTDLLNDLKTLLLAGSAATQEELCSALEKKGHEVNQSKISRLLHKIGAVKIMNERKQIVYSLPRDPAPPTSKNLFSQLIVNVRCNESLIVIHTNPGSASMIGRVLDHHRDDLFILGTVAGDDTVFITPLSIKKIAHCLQAIQTFILK